MTSSRQLLSVAKQHQPSITNGLGGECCGVEMGGEVEGCQQMEAGDD